MLPLVLWVHLRLERKNCVREQASYPAKQKGPGRAPLFVLRHEHLQNEYSTDVCLASGRPGRT